MRSLVLALMISGALPFVLTGIAKAGRFSRRANHATRDWQAKLEGWRQRAHWAHLNAFESFPLYAAAAICAHLAAPGSHTAELALWAYPALRVLYSICFIADWAELRSLAWFGAIGAIATLFSAAL